MTVVYPANIEIFAYFGEDAIELMPYQFGNISVRWGISNNGPIDFLAETGELKFNLQSPNGLFVPGSAGVISDQWKKGCIVVIEIVYGSEQKTFYGSVTNIYPQTDDVNNISSVYVVVSDWMEKAAKYPLNYPDVQLEQTADQIVQTIINSMPIGPFEQDFQTGVTTFPVVFDTVTDFTKARTEFQKVVFSELCYMYMRHSGTHGGKLVLENRHTRLHKELVLISNPSNGTSFLLMETGDSLLLETDDFILLDSITFSINDSSYAQYEVEYGKNIVNDVRFRYIPRKYSDTYPQLAYKSEFQANLTDPNDPVYVLELDAGETKIINSRWYSFNKLRANIGSSITSILYDAGNDIVGIIKQPLPTAINSASQMIDTPTYSAFTSSNPIVVNYFTPYIDKFEISITNNQAGKRYIELYITIEPTSAIIIKSSDVLADPIQDSTSITENDYQPIQFDMTYQIDDTIGNEFGNDVLALHKDPRIVLNKIYMNANRSEFYMNAFITLDIGDLIRVSHESKNIAGYFFVNEMGYDIKPGNIIAYYLGVTENLTPVKNLSIVTGTSNGGTSIILSHTIYEGMSLLVVEVTLRGSESVSSVIRTHPTGGINETLTLKSSKSFGSGAGDPRVEVWYILSPIPGTSNIIITTSGASFIQAASMDFYNVNQTTPFGTVVSDSGTGGTPSITIVGEPGDLIIDVIGVATGTITPDATQDSLWNASSDGSWRGGGSSEAGDLSVPMSWTLGGANKWALLGVAIKRM